MMIKELLTVLNSNAYLNIVSEKRHWMYEGKAILLPSELNGRTVKLIDVIRDEFFITVASRT